VLHRFRGLGLWSVVVVVTAGAQLGLPLTDAGRTQLGSEIGLFWLVVVAASLCVVTSLFAIARAWLDDTADLGIVGAFFLAVSLLPLVHGITTPGVIYGPNEATSTAVLWAAPMALMAGLPLLLPRSTRSSILRRWRVWVATNIGIQLGLAVLLLTFPSSLPLAGMGTFWARVITVVVYFGALLLSLRHLRLYRIGGSPSSLAVAVGYVLVASGTLVWIGDAPMTAGFWLAHVLDISGVFLGSIMGFVAYRRGQLAISVLRPLAARDPLDALEIGLEPVVRRFVADLQSKDEITHDHVKRTSELAIRLAEACGYRGDDLRTIGTAALLHDVGKLEIDDAVLNKPGRLSEAEFEHIKTHTLLGEQMLLDTETLGHLAPIVRQHHERTDGRGYPDGLRGDEIHPLATIIAVCDAFDAMAHTRQYREGMGIDKAVAILSEHAGSQWDADVVAAMVSLIEAEGVPEAPTVLADVGRSADCACGDIVAELHEMDLDAERV